MSLNSIEKIFEKKIDISPIIPLLTKPPEKLISQSDKLESLPTSCFEKRKNIPKKIKIKIYDSKYKSIFFFFIVHF